MAESESYARNVEILEEALRKADIWARRHAAKFAPDKFELIHFKNPREQPSEHPPTQQPMDIYDFIIPDPGTDQLPIQTPSQVIKPSPHAKYLGIWLDKELTFNTHREKLIGKANGSLEALRALTGSTWGATLTAMRTVYQAVEERIKCVIEDSADAAIQAHNQIQSAALTAKVDAIIAEESNPYNIAPQSIKKVIFFTDGSGHEEKIGASVVAPEHEVYARRHLGSAEQATVYTAELARIKMALDKFKTICQSNQSCELVIFADSQAAIQAMRNPKRPSGQHILRAIYAHVRAIQTPTSSSIKTPISIRWIPAHVGVHGNELADIEAKEAASEGFTGTGSDYLPPEPLRLAACAKRQVRSKIRAKWAMQWAREKTGKPNQRLVNAPHKKTLKLFEGLPKHYTSILVQMRNERKVMIDKIRIRTDLGGSTDYEALLSHPLATRYVAEFILQIGLLGQFRHYNVELEPDEDEETTGQN
ncbi:hypothetical protein N7490_006855 [Penicillium lividum]|nr:hypothetical protein N7490_006855 [Penicillium lividum]